MNVLCFDGMYMLHRARSGFKLGPAPVVYNFMRTFRSLVEQFRPNRVYFCLEGSSNKRNDLMESYKANRIVDEGTKEHDDLKIFYDQANIVIQYLKSYFPVSVMRHPGYECDDTIYNLVKRASSAPQWTIVSGDSDFTQLLNEFDNVRIYNPVKKSFVETPDYDYVTWKSLRGDPTDNIPGIPGIGDTTAHKIVNDPGELRRILSDEKNAEIFNRNYSLIKLIEWNDVDAFKMTSSACTRNWDPVKSLFESYGFGSMTNDNSWSKFVATFDPLFGKED